MKYVIKYLLNGDGSTPHFVEDGGYFPDGEELVGVSIDASKRYLPSDIQRLNKAQLMQRATGRQIRDLFGRGVSAQAKSDALEAWLEARGLKDYQ